MLRILSVVAMLTLLSGCDNSQPEEKTLVKSESPAISQQCLQGGIKDRKKLTIFANVMELPHHNSSKNLNYELMHAKTEEERNKLLFGVPESKSFSSSLEYKVYNDGVLEVMLPDSDITDKALVFQFLFSQEINPMRFYPQYKGKTATSFKVAFIDFKREECQLSKRDVLSLGDTELHVNIFSKIK